MRTRLVLESLEERTMPTVAFDPVYGAETLKADGGYRLNSPPVFLIFWGSNWVTYPDRVADLVNATKKLIDSPYFSGLSQYGTDGKVTWGGMDYDYGDPPPAFSSDTLYNVVRNLADNSDSHIPRPTTPSHLPIYMVITQPGTTSDQANALGYHTAASRVRFDVEDGFQRDLFYFGWISTGSGYIYDPSWVDNATTILSHELVETITDATAGGLSSDFPFGSVPDGLHVNPGKNWSSAGDTDPGDEICDLEAKYYQYRVNGVMVQSYLSTQKAEFQISDGNQQTFRLHTSSDGSRDLDVVGDQHFSHDDAILLSSDAQGDLLISLNNESASFDRTEVTNAVNVISGNGNDTITVNGSPSWAPVQITSEGGNASVTVYRQDDGVSDAPVTVQSPLSHTSLTIIDQYTATPLFGASLLLDADTADGPGFGEVRFTTFDHSVPVNYAYLGIVSLTVDSGGSLNDETDTIRATGVPTRLVTHSPHDTVNIGDGGSVAAIQGPLTIDEFYTALPVNDLVIDDQADPVARTVKLGTVSSNGQEYGQVTFTGGIAPINYRYAATNSVTVHTGTGAIQAYVTALGVATSLVGHGGATQIILGNDSGMVRDFAFPLTVSNPARGTTLTVNDSNDAVQQTVTVDVTAIDGQRYGRVTIPGQAPVYFKDGETAGVTVQTGAGAAVDVRGTLTPTMIVTRGVNTPVNVGNAGHIVDDFEADLFLTGSANSVTVTVDASNDSGTLGAFLDRVDRADGTYERIYNLAVGRIYCRYPDTHLLTLQTGTRDGPDPALVTVDATLAPTTLVGHGPTTVNVGRGSLKQIYSTLLLTNVVAQTTATIDDQNDTEAGQFQVDRVMIDGAPYGRVLSSLSSAAIAYKESDTASATIHTSRGGATVNVLAAGAATAIVGHAPATTIAVGANDSVQQITGPLSLRSAEGSITVALGDFNDSQARQMTHDTVLIDGTPYGRIHGLAPADIQYQYAGTDSVTIRTPFYGGTANVLATGAPLYLMSFEETVNVGDGGSVQNILGTLRITFATNAGLLNIDDSADPQVRTATYRYADDPVIGRSDQITGLAPAAIFHRAGEAVTVRAGVGGGTFNLISSGTPRTLSWIDNGASTVNVGNAGELLDFFPPVQVSAAAGATQLIVDNSAAPGGVTLDAQDNQATLSFGNGAYVRTLLFTGTPTSTLTVTVGAGVAIKNTTPFLTTINAGGDSSLYVYGFSPNTQVVVNGGAGSNRVQSLYSPAVPVTWHITGVNSGDLGDGVVQFSNYATITGGGGDDYFYFENGGSITKELHGGGGNDTLDYSGWSGDVLFYPLNWQATGIAFVDGIGNAVGGQGTSLLIGAAGGTKLLKGGTGRNILIAGYGAPATLIGHDDEDLLVGGWTSYDYYRNLDALEAILAEWARTDEDYDTRVANLLNGNGVPRLDKTSVFYNDGQNTLLGGAGRDLFFGRKATDQNDWDPNTETFVEV